jgi:hypothetical protein
VDGAVGDAKLSAVVVRDTGGRVAGDGDTGTTAFGRGTTDAEAACAREEDRAADARGDMAEAAAAAEGGELTVVDNFDGVDRPDVSWLFFRSSSATKRNCIKSVWEPHRLTMPCRTVKGKRELVQHTTSHLVVGVVSTLCFASLQKRKLTFGCRHAGSRGSRGHSTRWTRRAAHSRNANTQTLET